MIPEDVIRNALVGENTTESVDRTMAAQKIIAELDRWGFRIIRHRVVREPEPR